jgi:uncharacterized protein (DUF1499 family)
MPERTALSATASVLLGLLAVAATLGGAVAANQQWVPGFLGFQIFGAGIALGGALTLLLGLLGLARTRAGSGRSGRGRALAGTAIGGVLVVALLVLAAPGRNLPRINDITSDLADPPAFEVATSQPANRGRDLAYPGESFAAQQRRGYPDLAPLERAASPQESFADALAAADRLGWIIVAGDPMRLRFEAYEETSFFHFVDDVVVRVRPAPSGGGSIVDVRSKSRDGKGDIGANAARIRAFFAELGSGSPR